jgi:hypothetical protein
MGAGKQLQKLKTDQPANQEKYQGALKWKLISRENFRRQTKPVLQCNIRVKKHASRKAFLFVA